MRSIRSMRPIEYGLVVLSALFAVLCLRLMVWQLNRLHQRRAENAIVAARLTAPPVPRTQLPHDSAALHYRRTVVTGVYDYAHEVVLATRTRDGSPGVNLVTPLLVPGNDTAVLVNRGWIYAPDGMTANPALWREGERADGDTGYVVPFAARREGEVALPSHPHAYRWLDVRTAATAFPYPVHPYLVVLQGDVKTVGGILPRVAAPPLDEGPHMSYAIQWFAFAVIAIVGAILFVLRGSSSDHTIEIPVRTAGDSR